MNRLISIAAVLAAASACGGSTPKQYQPQMPPTETSDDQPAATASEEPAPPELVFPDEPFRAEQPAPSAPRPFQLPKIETFRLANGIEAFLVEQHVLPTISASLIFEGGATLDPKGKEGLASVCMGMLTEGTERLDKIAFNEALADTASTIGSWAGEEQMGVSMNTLSKHFDGTFALLRESLLEPGFRAAELERMVKRRIESIKQAKASPGSVASRVAPVVLYGPKHAFGRLTTEASLDRITLADCKRFHRQTIKPRGAQLFVVGDMTREQVQATFGKIPGWRGTAPKEPRLARPAPLRGKIFLVDVPGAAQSVVRLMHFGPKRTDEGYFANDIASAILGGGFTSRVNMNLREDKGYSYGARGGLQYTRNYGVLSAGARVRADSTFQSLRELIDEMQAMSTGERPATEAEISREQSSAILGMPGEFATARAALSQYRSLAYFGLPLGYYNDYVKNLEAVTVEQVNAAAKAHIRPGDAMVLVVGDASAEMITRQDGKDVPLVEDGKPVTLRQALEKLAASGDGIGKGSLVVLDADGNVVAR